MVVFPNGKINLGLHITGKRPDGYHNLETIFFPVPFRDALELLPQMPGEKEDSFVMSGIPIAGDPNNNLCRKAVHLLRRHYPQIPPVRIHLHKTIPTGAGMGGGSSNGAFVLRLLNDSFQLNLSSQQLKNFALELGSDCPFFIENAPCFATGRGEILEPLSLHLPACTLVLVNPGIHVSTAAAFAGITPHPTSVSLKEVIRQPIGEWKKHLKNDFETTVFEQFPAIAAVKEALYEAGAAYAAMSGSGSTVFGLFLNGMPSLSFPQDYLVLSTPLAADN